MALPSQISAEIAQVMVDGSVLVGTIAAAACIVFGLKRVLARFHLWIGGTDDDADGGFGDRHW